MPFPRRIFPGRLFPERLFPGRKRKAPPRTGYTAPEGADAESALTGPQLIRQVSMIPVPIIPELVDLTYSPDPFYASRFGGGSSTNTKRYTLDSPPIPMGDVALTVRTKAHLHGTSQYVSVTVYNVVTGANTEPVLFWADGSTGQECATDGQEATGTIPQADWAAMLSVNGDNVKVFVHWHGSLTTPLCNESFVEVDLSYAYGSEAGPAYIGWRSLDPVLSHNGHGLQYLWGDLKYDPVAGGLVVVIRSADRVCYAGAAGSPDEAVEGSVVGGYGGRPGDRCLEARGVYQVRGTVVAFSSAGPCTPE